MKAYKRENIVVERQASLFLIGHKTVTLFKLFAFLILTQNKEQQEMLLFIMSILVSWMIV